jgi:hypothetical protein
MAKARKTAVRARTPARARTKRGTKGRSGSRAASKAAARKKAKPSKGVIATVKKAATAVADTFEESRAMARKAGPSGGLSDG